MRQRSRVAHFAIDVDDLDKGVALWPAALDAKEEQLSEASSQVYRKLRRRPAGGAVAPAEWRDTRLAEYSRALLYNGLGRHEDAFVAAERASDGEAFGARHVERIPPINDGTSG